MSGHRIPLHPGASDEKRLLHCQAMAQMARVTDDQGGLAGFRPRFMERVLVAFGHADSSLLAVERSERSKRKARAKAEYLRRCRAQRN